SRRPLEGRLGPQRHVAEAADRDRRLDRLAHARRGRIDLQVETESLPDDIRGIGRWRQRQYRNRDRVAAQGVALLATEERERDRQRVLNRCRRDDETAGRQG